MVAIFSHGDCLDHNMGAGHPEQPDRYKAALAALERFNSEDITRYNSPLADRKLISLMHTAQHVENVFRAIDQADRQGNQIQIDADTAVCAQSGDAALRALGGVIAAIDLVISTNDRKQKHAFCISRPPGHHAEPDAVMGFCLFNSIAIGAAYAQKQYGLKNVAVVDFDVHHGNGTEACFLNHPNLLYCSTHQAPLYPHTGQADFTGPYQNIVNCPLPYGDDGQAFRAAYTEQIFPKLKEFAPDLILISAGFDAHKDDPLAQLELESQEFEWVSKEICAIAGQSAQGRVVSMLEGGYDLAALTDSVYYHICGLKE